MTHPARRHGLSNFWTVTGLSAATLAVLVMLLWSPWDRPGIVGKSVVVYCAAGMARPVTEIAKGRGWARTETHSSRNPRLRTLCSAACPSITQRP